MQGLKHMAVNEGLRGMFRGNWTNCLRIVPNSAIKFLTYEQLTRYSPSPDCLLSARFASMVLPGTNCSPKHSLPSWSWQHETP